MRSVPGLCGKFRAAGWVGRELAENSSRHSTAAARTLAHRRAYGAPAARARGKEGGVLDPAPASSTRERDGPTGQQDQVKDQVTVPRRVAPWRS
eukprot:g77641.t1